LEISREAIFSPSIIEAELLAGVAKAAVLVTRRIARMALLNMVGSGKLMKLISGLHDCVVYQLNISCQEKNKQDIKIIEIFLNRLFLYVQNMFKT
jgi:hypothetical protein